MKTRCDPRPRKACWQGENLIFLENSGEIPPNTHKTNDWGRLGTGTDPSRVTLGTGTEVDTGSGAAWPCRPVCPCATNPLPGRTSLQGEGQSIENRGSPIRSMLGVPRHALGKHGLARAGVAAGTALDRTAVADRSGVALGVARLGMERLRRPHAGQLGGGSLRRRCARLGLQALRDPAAQETPDRRGSQCRREHTSRTGAREPRRTGSAFG